MWNPRAPECASSIGMLTKLAANLKSVGIEFVWVTPLLHHPRSGGDSNSNFVHGAGRMWNPRARECTFSIHRQTKQAANLKIELVFAFGRGRAPATSSEF